jgi:hypothetical protein
MAAKLGTQHATKQKRITSRLTRDEAIAYLADMLMGRELPFTPDDYPGGPSQILSDAVCISPESIRNYSSRGRRALSQRLTG